MSFIGTLAGSISGRTGSSQDAALTTANKYHKRFMTSTYTGSSGGTCTFLMYGRHWWGVGACHIHIHETWYGPNSSYGHFLIHGHTRSGNPSIATIYNQGVPTPYATGYNSSRESCHIKFDSGAYYTYNIQCWCYNMTYTTSTDVGPGGQGSNTWHMPGSHEVI